MRFDWTDLQVFLHVCDAKSMTAAASRCHLTLAAVSARIRTLEEVNGVVLLERRPRGVEPTAAGRILARHARAVFEQVQALDHDLLHAREEAPRFTLLANAAALARPLARALAGLPLPDGTQVIVRESASEATVHALRSGAADVGIVSDAIETRGLLTHDVGPDPLVLVAPAGHPLASRASVRFEEVLAQPWVAWGEQGAIATHLLIRAIALDRQLQTRVSYPHPNGVLRLVADGAGVTVMPLAVVEQHRAGLAIASVPMDEPWANRNLLVCHAGGSPAREQLAQRLLAFAAARPG